MECCCDTQLNKLVLVIFVLCASVCMCVHHVMLLLCVRVVCLCVLCCVFVCVFLQVGQFQALYGEMTGTVADFKGQLLQVMVVLCCGVACHVWTLAVMLGIPSCSNRNKHSIEGKYIFLIIPYYCDRILRLNSFEWEGGGRARGCWASAIKTRTPKPTKCATSDRRTYSSYRCDL